MTMPPILKRQTNIMKFKYLLAPVVLFVLTLFINTAKAQSPRPDFTATTDPSTWRGVALQLKFTAATGIMDKVLQQSDFDYAAACGANVVRLAIHADPKAGRGNAPTSTFVDNNGNVIDAANSPGIADLKKAAAMAGKVGIKLIIDMHAAPNATNGTIFGSQADWDNLLHIWTEIAETFKNNPNVIAFDLMNEPKLLAYLRSQGTPTGNIEKTMFARTWTEPKEWTNTPRDYNMQITNIIRAIRNIDPDRTVIVEGFGVLGNPSNFAWMKPVEGFKNVVYSAHIYEPAKLVFIGMRNFKNKNSQALRFDPNDNSALERAFAPLIAFQHKYNVPIYVGEFGISDDAIFGADNTGRSYNGSCWLTTILKMLDDNHFGWTYWDFWHNGMFPKKTDDPRYLALSAAMRHKPLPDYCSVH